ncbi:MAG: hypothetical protein HY901_34735 [Deltaproteobacteria bacterium]|nr:hypothetical protein [Deltaproteobacteria bacterium]
MGAIRTAWHVLFVEALKERRPPGFEVQAEVPLSSDPLRVDVLLLRREGVERRDGEARILSGLWPLVEREALVEYKSPARPFRRGDAYRLLSYGAQYEAEHIERLARGELALVLAVATRTSDLAREIARMGCRLESSSRGCDRIKGTPWPAWVVVLGELSEADHDDLLRCLATGKIQGDALRWCWSHVYGPAREMQMSQLEGYDELVKKMLATLTPKQRLEGLSTEERLGGLSTEERLAGLSPEERLADLSPEERLLSLSDHLLRQLPESLVASLPEHVRQRIQARLRGHG